MAGYLAGDVDKWIYIDIADQHEDSMRFIRDCISIRAPARGATYMHSADSGAPWKRADPGSCYEP